MVLQRPDRAVVGLWLVYGGVLALTVATYWRLDAGETYHFDDAGPSGAVSRAATYLNYPVAIAAVGLVWAVCRGVLAMAATALCLVAFLPGVVSQDHLTARWANLPAVLGVLLAAVLSLTARADPTTYPLGRRRWAAVAVLTVLALPYLAAAAGFYPDHVPLLGHLVRGSQPTPGDPTTPTVHRGLHDGLFGVMLAVTALALSARRLSRGLGLYLALMLTYGTWIAAGDLWHEQVVKRGWVETKVPDVLQPGFTLAWGVLLLVAFGVFLLLFRQRAAEPARDGA